VNSLLTSGATGGYTSLNNHALRLGMRGKLYSKEYVAVAQIIYRQPEAEGGVSRWEEWILVSKDNHIRYLECDSGRWRITEEWVPPAGTRRTDTILHLPGNQLAHAIDQGLCQRERTHGIMPWETTFGEEQIAYVDYTRGSDFYSFERNVNGEETFYKGHNTNLPQVYAWFGLQKEIVALNKHQDVRTDRLRFGGILLLLACLSFFGGCIASSTPGKVVAGAHGTAQELGDMGKPFGAYPLLNQSRPYKLKLWTEAMSQSSLAAMAVIEDKEGAAYSAQQEFWDESGYDDGAWHEWNLQSTSTFRLAKPGEYNIRLYADPEVNTAQHQVAFELEQGVWDVTPLYWFGGIALALGIIWLCAGAPSETWRQA
jgi:hypothetical protein